MPQVTAPTSLTMFQQQRQENPIITWSAKPMSEGLILKTPPLQNRKKEKKEKKLNKESKQQKQ
jgi:hypothetical protein